MAEHVYEHLNAYLDGELSGRRQEQVERHLIKCGDCQAELEALHRLSQALQETASTPEFPPAERFTAKVMLRLPRLQVQPPRRSMREMGWWLVPAALLLVWAFIQSVFWLSSGISTVEQAGIFGDEISWLVPQPQGSGLLTGAFQWLGVIHSDSMQQIAEFSEGIGWNLLTQLVLNGALALIYLGWLATWLLRSQNAGAQVLPVVKQKNGI